MISCFQTLLSTATGYRHYIKAPGVKPESDASNASLGARCPLVNAAYHGCIEVVEALLAAGGNPEATGVADTFALAGAVSGSHTERAPPSLTLDSITFSSSLKV